MRSSIIVMLVLVCATGSVMSCAPCKCSSNTARCDNVALTSVPSADTLPADTQLLFIEGASIPTIHDNQFASFPKLLQIHITRSSVVKVEGNAFRNLAKLNVIKLDYNLITELPAELFSNTPRLVEVSITHNKLKALLEATFSNLNYLKTVLLNDNEITKIEANCFVNVPLLEIVYLQANKMTTLNRNIIPEPKSLKQLTVRFNPWHCDESLCALMATYLSGQFWDSWGGSACATPESLQGKEWDELREHSLMRQCECRLEGPSVARCTTPRSLLQPPIFRPTDISHLHVTDQVFTTLEDSVFSAYTQLQELHVERCNIVNIKSNAFSDLSHLHVLNLADNKLNKLETDTFRPTVNVEKILLNKNNLMRLDNFVFANLVMLKEVDLSFNNINFVEDQCFVNVSSLRFIDVSNNQLQTLQLTVLASGVGLERLYLEGNPWRCDEALCGVMNAVVGGALWGARPAPVCAAPSAVATKSWPQLPRHFHPSIMIRDSTQKWVPAGRTTKVGATHDVRLQCRYCFVSRVSWALNGVKLPASFQRKSHETLISTLIMENIQKEDQGNYVCQVSQCADCDTAWLHVNVDLNLPGRPGLQQECGQVVPEGVTNIVNGTSVQKGEFPWHIAIYRLVGDKHLYQCGGSIISPTIIITAAHCFTDERALRYPAGEFFIGAGKYYSDYYSALDIFNQRRQVKEFHIPTEYKGYDASFAGDLALAVVHRAFRMTNVVQPVCINWDDAIEREQLKQNNSGSVVGWGYTDPNTQQSSTVLRRLNPLFIDQEQCYKDAPENFRRWLTLDKFCAGFLTGASICNGDSGGGLVFQWNNTQKYYIRGLASVGPKRKGACDNFQYSVYTKVSYYKTFIQNIININPVND